MSKPRMLCITLAVSLAACGGDASGRWAGTVVDSAGIPVVQNPSDGVWDRDAGWRVEERLRIGTAEGDPEYQFGQIVSVTVDDRNRIYVLDQQAQRVRVYDADGIYLHGIGRPGSGPGELSRGAGPVMIGAGDTVIIPDVAQQRVNRYLGDGTEAGSFPLPLSDGIPLRWDLTPDRRLVQQVRRMDGPGQGSTPQPDYVLMRATDGSVRDTVLELPAGQTVQFSGGMPRFRFFEAEPIWALTEAGQVLFGVNTGFRIEVRAAGGTVDRIITKPFERLPVTEADRQTFIEFFRETFQRNGVPPEAQQALIQNMTFADHYPAYATLMGGPDGSIWVQRVQSADQVAALGGEFSAEEIGAPEWDVFDAEGHYLGVVSLPARFRPMRFRGNQIYGVWRDDLDVQHVLRLDIVGPTPAGA